MSEPIVITPRVYAGAAAESDAIGINPTSFREMVMRMAEIDSDGRLVIDVDRLVSDIARKVDAIKYVKDELADMEEHFKAKAEPFLKAARSCASERQRLVERTKQAMLDAGNDKMPGEDWRIQINEGKDTVEFEGLPSRFEYDLYPQFVKVEYAWDRAAIYEALKDGYELPFAKLKKVKSLNFYLNTDRTLVAKRIKEKKK